MLYDVMYIFLLCIFIHVCSVFVFVGVGRWLVLADSMAKYVSVNACTDVIAHRGDTVQRLTDRIALDRLSVRGYSRILIHVGTNDISNWVDNEEQRYVSVIGLINRFKALRNVIRAKNRNALLLFSSILPRRDRY